MSAKMLLGGVGSIAFVALSFFLVTQPHPSPKALIGGMAGVVVFGAFSVLAVVRAVRPDTLELSPAGIRFTSLVQREFDLPWRDVQNVWLWSYRSSRSVVFDIAPSAKMQIRRGLSGRLSKADVNLPGGWPIGPDALLALILDAKHRWGGPEQSCRSSVC